MDSAVTPEIAIIGLACRFPEANTPDEYWDIFKTGRNTSSTVPASRVELCGSDSIPPGSVGNFLKCPVDQFDAHFFGMSPKEAQFTDPQGRLALEVSWEALEDARINPDCLRNKPVGVFYGSWIQDYKDLLNKLGRPSEDFMRKYLGNSFGATAAKLSFFYKFMGENVATESGCSSSMVAVALACQSLREKRINLAMVTGANLVLQMDTKQKGLWAEDGKCKSFDEDARGYGRGEGVACLILKRADMAIKDGDRIHGIILGEGVCQEGTSKSFGAPTIEREVTCMKMALERSGVAPAEVDYVEAHATGTAVGDPVECEAICRAYQGNGRAKPLLVGSGKGNIGHSESSSGLAGIIKVLLAFKHEIIPKQIIFSKINTKINFDSVPSRIPLENEPLRRSQGRPRVAGVSSFGITGTCVHIIIREPEMTHATCHNPAPNINLLQFSAKSIPALEELKHRYLSHITPEDCFKTCYTASTSRSHSLGVRKALILSGNELIKEFQSKSVETQLGNICFTFPGVVGSMDFSAARHLYLKSKTFNKNMTDCNDIWMAYLQPYSLIECLNKNWTVSEPKTWIWYATALSIQYSLAKLWMSWSLTPDLVLGHSMGEICAAVVSGRMELQDAFKILKVSEYFEKYKNAPGAQMLIIHCGLSACSEIISGLENQLGANDIDVALVNSHTQTVIATSSDSAAKFGAFCDKRGVKVQPIKNMEFAVHSRFVEESCKQAENDIFNFIKYKSAQIPHVSSLHGEILSEEGLHSQGKSFWYRMFRNTVQFTEACQTTAKNGVDVYLEIGLGSTLTKFTVENLGPFGDFLAVPSFQSAGDHIGLELTAGELYINGVDINWEAYYKDKGVTTEKIDLPHYPFQRESFWFKKKIHETPEQVLKMAGNLVSNTPEAYKFQVAIDYNSFPDLYDHKIGEKVIFPAAGYLEMACSAVQMIQSHTHVLIENLKIQQPVVLDRIKATKLHIHVTIKEGSRDSWKILITSQEAGLSEWRRHASCEASLNTSYQPGAQIFPPSLTWIDVTPLYEDFKGMAINYGDSFKSLEAISKYNSETFGRVSFPDDYKDYCLHPVLADAMIQLSMAHSLNDFSSLQLPVQISKFYVTKQKSQIPGSRLLLRSGIQDTGEVFAFLESSAGNVIAYMQGLSFVSTSLEKFMKRMENQKYVGIYEETWIEILRSGETCGKDPGTWVVFHDVSQDIYAKLEEALSNYKLIDVPIKDILDDGANVEFILSRSRLNGVLFLTGNNEENPDNVLKALFLLSQSVLRAKMVERFHLMSTTSSLMDSSPGERCTPSLLWGFMRTFRMEYAGVSKSIGIDMTPNSKDWAGLLRQELDIEGAYHEPEVIFQEGQRFCRRIQTKSHFKGERVQVPESSFTLEYPQSKLLSDVYFSPVADRDPGEGHVLVEVKCCALNFKDVLTIISPGHEFNGMKGLGLDYSGVISKLGPKVDKIWREGDPVFGFECSEATVTRRAIIDQNKLTKLPTKLTFSDGAALPTVFLTAWHCLSTVARLKSDQTILIHAAAGGVGLASIQICKYIGATILCTAGSQKKRDFLRKLGVSHVYNSRSLKYLSKIRQDLKLDRPVDVVLNCLTGPGFKEASLELIKDGGHFVEISKLDIWTPGEFKSRRRNVTYSVVNAMEFDLATYSRGMAVVVKFINEDVFKPLPCSIFPANQVISGLKYLQKAKNIGKVVLQMPHDGKYPLFNDRSSYFISGGKGTLGLEIARWMVTEQGAKYIILGSRSKSNENVCKMVNEVRNANQAKIICVEIDVSDYPKLRNLLETLSKDEGLPPLRGIHHCAGMLVDKLIVHQTWTDFEAVLDGKAKGAQNLHRATLELDLHLEFFVMHGSMCATFGNVGQANYTAANAYLNGLANVTSRMGLPAMCINWGKWEAGLGGNSVTPILKEFSVDEGINTLERIMRESRGNGRTGSVLAGAWRNSELLKVAPYYKKSLIQVEMVEESGGKIEAEGTIDWRKVSPEARSSRIFEIVKQAVCETLGVPQERLEDNTALSKLGMDSLMGIEFTNRLVLATGVTTMPSLDLEEDSTLTRICAILEEKMSLNSS